MLDQNTSRAKLEQTMVRCLGGVRKVDLSYSANRNQGRPLQVKVARRYRVTIPNDVREKAKISVGDELDVRYEDGRILLEKLEDNWEKVMAETERSWAKHPVFGKMKNSAEIVHWLRSPRKTSRTISQ